MAIVISGTGTIDGISAGGLPDDCVTADDLAETYFVPSTQLSHRNLIINGAMQVAQRNTQVTGITTAGYRTCDRMYTHFGSLGTWTADQSTDAPNGFSNSFKLTCTASEASPGTGDLALASYWVEAQDLQCLGYGTSGAKTSVISFWVKSNKTGDASFNVRQLDNSNKNFSSAYTINSADTWEQKTIVIPADTSGVINNDNGGGFALEWFINSGSNYTSGSHSSTYTTFSHTNRNPSNLGVGGATSDYWAITGLQLEVGSVATPFEHRSYGEELARCQRYYYRHADWAERGGNAPIGLVSFWVATAIDFVVSFPCQMRVNPSIQNFTGSSDWIIYKGNATVIYATTGGLSLARNGRQTVHLSCSTTTSGTPGQTAFILANASGVHLSFDAEL